MSRSFKHNPICSDGTRKTTKAMKRYANKVVRHCKEEIPSKGKKYKQLFCSYNIHDYVSRWSWPDAKALYEEDRYGLWHERYPTLKEFYRHWLRYYKRK